MRCPQCHTEVTEGTAVCARCGILLTGPLAAATAPAAAAVAAAAPEGEASAALFGFAVAESAAEAVVAGRSRVRRAPVQQGPRPQMVALADFGKPPPPAPRTPVNWTRRAITLTIIVGGLLVVLWVTAVAGVQMANFYGGANELRARDRFGASVR